MFPPINNFFTSLFTYDTEARTQAREARYQVSDVAGRVDRLSLMMMAVWTLARDHLGLTEEQLLQRIQDLDMTDGKLDGKIGSKITQCPGCHRPLSPRHQNCIYCGHKREDVSAP